MRSRMVYARAMYQSLRVAGCGSLDCRWWRWSIKASAIASALVPVRMVSWPFRFLDLACPLSMDFMESHRRQAFRPEDCTRLFGRFVRRRLNGIQRVRQAEPRPLEPPQLVKWEHFDPLDVAQTGGE